MVDGEALREAIINAIVHNDYTREVPPLFEIFSDRIVITSYGGLVRGLLREEFFKGCSMIRNRELMRVFKDLELVEQLGSGMKRIMEVYDESIFEFTPNFMFVTFPFEQGFNESDVNGNSVNNNERIMSEYERIMSEYLTETEKKKMAEILDYLKDNDSVDNKKGRELTGKSAATIRRYFERLCDIGLIKPTGKTINTVYKKTSE